ncbi:MAG: UDP-N-acetylmuramate--L-alanine ligase [Acidobacteriota bacterium]|nr:UDP-N-acetylmuramate--L-alanine ligase [Acidobacteriota bacterium]
MTKKFHFIGIGGAGMSGLAEILLLSGCEVSGSDLQDSSSLERLRQLGAQVFIGHDSDNLSSVDTVVFSSAVSGGNPELVKARSLCSTVISRGELLADLMNSRKGISVAGTHGKTTTTAMIGLCLLKAGIDPTVVVGARFEVMHSNARLGKGEWFVAEADESDRSFLMLSPFCSVVTNIDLDHMDEYHDLVDLQDAFLKHLNRTATEGLVVACTQDVGVMKILKKLHLRVVTYGLEMEADVCARQLELAWRNASYDCYEDGECLGRIRLGVPGRHNVLNSLAAVAVARKILQVPFEIIQDSLEAFHGVERRLQWKGERGGVWVVDDYAHHPAEIRATLETCKVVGRRIIVIFQPHRYTRTQYVMKELSQCFNDADILYLMDIYPAGEQPIAGVTSEHLAHEIGRFRAVNYLSDEKQLLMDLKEEVRAGDLLITLGAGNVWEIGAAFLEKENL